MKQSVSRWRRYVTVFAVVCALMPRPLDAAVPHLVRYQGQAVDNLSVPLQGPYNLTFRLYDADAGGTIVWQEQQANIPINKGHFSVLLGQVTALNVDWSRSLWLTIQVGTDSELLPRQRITSVPLAVRAEVAEGLTTPLATSAITDDANRLVPTGAILLWTGSTCPAGYTRVSAFDGKFLVSDAAYNPAAGGSATHDHGGATGSHVLTIEEIPPHAHNIDYFRGDQESTPMPSDSYSRQYHQTRATSSAGGGQGHTHPLSAADNRPPYATILFCGKS